MADMIDWDIDLNVPLYTRDYLEMNKKEVAMADNLNVTTEHESPINHPEIALDLVSNWATHGLGVRDEAGKKVDFYIVWFCFILGGWKALVSSTAPDGRYYEVTFNKQKNVAYVDTYRKTHNHEVIFQTPSKRIVHTLKEDN